MNPIWYNSYYGLYCFH